MFFACNLETDSLEVTPKSREFRIMHHGSIVHRHGIDHLIHAVAKLRTKIPQVRLDVYGSHTAFEDELQLFAKTLNITDIVTFHGPKSQSEIAQAIRDCDLGVVPNRRSSFIELNFPTRIFEYLALRRPVIAPDTQGIRDYFNQSEMIFFQPSDVADLAEKIYWVYSNPHEVANRVNEGIRIYQSNQWSSERSRFLKLVGSLCP